jgi:hypothetical protein
MAGGSGQQAEEDRDRRSEVRGQRTEDIEDVGGAALRASRLEAKLGSQLSVAGEA